MPHMHTISSTLVALRPSDKDSPKLDNHTCKGQSPGIDDNMQDHQAPFPGPGTVYKEQDTHSGPADQLEGEELEMPAISSELTAAPGTPSSFNTSMSPTMSPKITPLPEPAPELHNSSPPVALAKNAHGELTFAPTHTVTATVKIWSDNPDPQPGDGVAHLGTYAPCLALSMHPPVAF